MIGRFAQNILSDLKLQLNDRFSDPDARATEIRIFQNPFDCVIDEVPPELQKELIDLQSSDMLKDKYKEGILIEFYKCLPSDQYVHLKDFARGFTSISGTTYLCEKTFSKMKYMKSSYRAMLSDDRLQSLLMIGSTNFEPQLSVIY